MPVNKLYYQETDGKHTVILALNGEGYRRTFETEELARRCVSYLESCIGGLDPQADTQTTAMLLFATYI
jgi:hypothetical protein